MTFRSHLLLSVLFALVFVSAAARAQQAHAEADRFGGVHELNLYAGHSWHAGPLLGFVPNTKYTTVVARYSYQLREFRFATLRYAPELTLLADLYEPSPSPGGIHGNVPSRAYGGGVSPGDLQLVFFARHRVQPYLNADGGMLFYNQRVLSDGGTQFMFTVDLGPGVNLFVTRHDAITVNFRYQHQSNADIGLHNPGTDAELFCFGFSHFFNLR